MHPCTINQQYATEMKKDYLQRKDNQKFRLQRNRALVRGAPDFFPVRKKTASSAAQTHKACAKEQMLFYCLMRLTWWHIKL
jgi:hypothetical protein